MRSSLLTHPAPEGGYLAHVDGLRAVAVLMVLLFHYGFGFPGGYAGVDVFFVLSGFLITRILLRTCEISLTKHDGKPICGA
jgi:peptidoglycan/LPS O-acetylase OafA/YrhL